MSPLLYIEEDEGHGCEKARHCQMNNAWCIKRRCLMYHMQQNWVLVCARTKPGPRGVSAVAVMSQPFSKVFL